MNADKLFKAVIGRDPDHNHETTHRYASVEDDIEIKKPVNNSETLTKTQNQNNTKEEQKKPKTVADYKLRLKIMEMERRLDEYSNPVPNFDQGEDDPDVITRRYDKLIEDQGKTSLRQKQKIYLINWRNIWRNRTLTIMQHFLYSTRYKLPYSQKLRKKYYDSPSYRIGFCFGLLRHLKMQQMIMYSQLTDFQFTYDSLHMHMKLYEKIVRLDVDMRDIMKHIRELESKRRLQEDPNYYDEDSNVKPKKLVDESILHIGPAAGKSMGVGKKG
jgi:hypothetical protein